MTPKIPTEYTNINPNINPQTQKNAQAILQQDGQLSRKNRQLDHKTMAQYQSSKVKDLPVMQPTKSDAHQKELER